MTCMQMSFIFNNCLKCAYLYSTQHMTLTFKKVNNEIWTWNWNSSLWKVIKRERKNVLYFSCPNSTESFSIIDIYVYHWKSKLSSRENDEWENHNFDLDENIIFLCKIIQEKVKSGSDSDIAQRATERIYNKQKILLGGGGSLFKTSQYFQDGML